MTYQTEFPDFELGDIVIPANMRDTSWREDGCPSWRDETNTLCLWVDYADPAQRFADHQPRFTLTSENCDIDIQTDDWAEIVRVIERWEP